MIDGLVACDDKKELSLLSGVEVVEGSKEKDVTSSYSQYNEVVIEHTHHNEIETTIYLGRNLFVLCSLLVGSSMALGVISALFTTLAVLVGIALILSLPALDLSPVLPDSIALGMAAHFSAVAQMTAIRDVYNSHTNIERLTVDRTTEISFIHSILLHACERNRVENILL